MRDRLQAKLVEALPKVTVLKSILLAIHNTYSSQHQKPAIFPSSKV